MYYIFSPEIQGRKFNSASHCKRLERVFFFLVHCINRLGLEPNDQFRLTRKVWHTLTIVHRTKLLIHEPTHMGKSCFYFGKFRRISD